LPAATILSDYANGLSQRSVAVVAFLERRQSSLIGWWLVLAGAASLLRILVSPSDLSAAGPVTVAPYLLLVFAPVTAMLLAFRWFDGAEHGPQPAYRLALIGQWRALSEREARAHPLYGTSGIMVSLMVGILLNIPVRAAEYLATMPAITAAAPEWLSILHFWMTLDVVLISSLYAVCFVAAFRRAPFFPRLLVLVWMIDIGMQLLVAHGSVAAGLPAPVAAPLHDLLEKNITKVLISMGLWLPYLLLSTRVNVTYRQRVPA
jgi:hypothetical protein